MDERKQRVTSGLDSRIGVLVRHARLSARTGCFPLRTTGLLAHALLLRPDRVWYRPQFAKIEITTRCNLVCRFCLAADGRSGSGRGGEDLALGRLEALLDGMPQLRWAEVQGVGEPLMHAQFPAVVQRFRQRGIMISLTTNATILDGERRAALLAARLHNLAFSVSASRRQSYQWLSGSDCFDRVVANIAAFVRAAPQNGPDLRIVAVPLAPLLADLPLVVETAARCGIGRVILTRYQPRCADDPLVPELDSLKAAVERTRTRGVQEGIDVRVEDGRLLGGREGARSGAPAMAKCPWPWTMIFIDLEGNLRPCCYAPEGPPLGNVYETAFDLLWNGPAYRRFRCAVRGGEEGMLQCSRCQDLV